MSEPLTLADFLLARIAEDEDAARAAAARRRDEALAAASAFGVSYLTVGGPCDPGRMLAECEAKGRILAEHVHQYHGKKIPSYAEKLECETCAKHGYTESYGEVWRCGELWPCDTLRSLAAIYADHADYRDEWRPVSLESA